jgi:hypothetical protein
MVTELTFTGTVGSSKNCALFYGSEWGKQLAYIFLGLLLAKHTHKQLSVFWRQPQIQPKTDREMPGIRIFTRGMTTAHA